MTRPVLVVGIGNLWRGDDAAGIAVARRLREKPPPRAVVVESDGEVSALLEAFRGRSRAILVDSSHSGLCPGTVRRFEVQRRALPAAFRADSTHALGLSEGIELARALGQLPARVVVYAIEGRTYELGAALSPEVQDAVCEVEKRVRLEFARGGGT